MTGDLEIGRARRRAHELGWRIEKHGDGMRLVRCSDGEIIYGNDSFDLDAATIIRFCEEFDYFVSLRAAER